MTYAIRIFLLLVIFTSATISQNIRDISKVGPETEMVDQSSYDTNYYVAVNRGSDKEGDGSADNPWKTITYALKQVENNSEVTRTALIIGAGVYSGSTLIMKKNVDLFGGFNCQTWERDIHKYSSILDGESARRVVIGANNSRIDGFTITSGLSRTHGGGILCDDTSPEISNCFITNNFVLEPENFNHTRIHQDAHHGAGIACFFNAVPVIRNNVFYGNRTSIGNGAGVAFYGWLRIKGSPETSVHNNVVEGGLQPLLENNVFVQNVSGVNDIHRTRSSNGAAVSCAFESRPIIKNNVIAANQAKGRSDAGGIYSEYFSYPVIDGNWIVGNISDDDGGGIYTMKLGQVTIKNNFIAGNWTIGNGVGGIRLSKEGRATISDNIIVQNLTGGGIDCVDSYMEVENNIIMHNKGKAAIRYSNHYTYYNSSVLKGNIIRENENKVAIETFGGSDVIFDSNNMDETVVGSTNIDEAIEIEQNESIAISDIEFNGSLYQSIIKIDKSLEAGNYDGRTVKINKFWTVIHNVVDNKIYIWGDASANEDSEKVIEIISDYKLN